MSELLPPPEHESADLQEILHRQTDYLATVLYPNTSEAHLMREGIRMELEFDPSRFGVYPALVTKNSAGTRFTLHYDLPTMELLVDSFAQTYQVSPEELSELYIGTAVAAHILSSRVRDQNMVRMGRLMNVLTDIGPVCDLVQMSDIVPDEFKQDARHNLMQSNTARAGNINILRFAFGMVYPQTVENILDSIEQGRPHLSKVQQQFRGGLLSRLSEKEVYVKFGEAFKQDARIGERVFADNTGEFELAACFPMSPNELTRILSICKD